MLGVNAFLSTPVKLHASHFKTHVTALNQLRELGSKVAALALATPGPVFFAYEEGRCAGHQAVLVRVVRQSLQNFNFISKVLQGYFSQ